MQLNKEKTLREFPIIFLILTYAFFINWMSGNIGVMPIDTFGFLDTGYNILNNNFPIRDFWIFTGLLVDYMEAAFLFLFGNNWNSHLAHGSFMNMLATICFYFFLNEIGLKKKYSIFYSVCFATLCYPVSGTPFAYLHSYIFSLLSMMTLIVAIKNESRLLWFCFPFISLFSFLSMQTPSVYVLTFLSFVMIYYFAKSRNYENLIFFLTGCLTCTIIFLFFLFVTNTSINNFLYQYILFPLTIGENRLLSNDTAYISLIDQLNFKRLIGEFKFIHIFLLPLIFLFLKNFKKNQKILNMINFTIIVSSLSFYFNQLITANQIFIFSLIPVIASILHLNILKLNLNPKIILLIILVVFIASIKFHLRFNIDRKFHDLENIDKNNAINANLIHQNFKNLKWVNKFEDDPNFEINLLKNAIKIIDEDDRDKLLITHYQFFSTILGKKINILNRWYLWDNNTHPTENHKYFNFYKEMVKKNILSNNIKVIYLLGQKNEISFQNVKNYFTDLCFESKTIVEDRFSMHEIKNCENIK